MSERVNHRAFVAALGARFPEVAASIDPEVEGGLLHLEMGAFLQHTMDAIRNGDRDVVAACFAFADDLLVRGDDAVVNAVYVSFLEHLVFEGRKTAWAKTVLSPRLEAARQEIAGYMQQLERARVARHPKRR